MNDRREHVMKNGGEYLSFCVSVTPGFTLNFHLPQPPNTFSAPHAAGKETQKSVCRMEE
ncbi:MAG: hypothetical protein Q4C96_03845 [Planctomycetia bacterium]|nr:hypothetical protein [Planctomycetia bacterium]